MTDSEHAARVVDRRAVLVLGAGLAAALAGCSSTSSTGRAPTKTRGAAGSGTPGTRPPSSTLRSTPKPPPLPSPPPWHSDRGDIDPIAKRTAAGVVEAIGSWTGGEWGLAQARRRVEALDQRGSLADQAPQLQGRDDRASLHVIEAQTGGLLTSTASILVVCEQWRASADGRPVRGGTTVDVRLSRRGNGWQVTALHPARPGRPLRSRSSLQRSVLASMRILLPPAAVADVESGRVHDSVLEAMLTLAKRYRIHVSVVRSGHPIYVFGTDRLSDHPRGRAFDTFAIDGHLVVDPATPRDLVVSYMEAARAAGSYNVGGPYWLTGPDDQYFSDQTHHDHVHAGFLT